MRSIPFLLAGGVIVAGLALMFAVQIPLEPAAVILSEEAPPCVTLTRSLSFGSTDAKSDGEVSKLQQFLSLDSAIYPQALVTGYFGSLTAQAVKRWQAGHGIAQVGIVGPLTRSKLLCKTPPAEAPPTSTPTSTPSTPPAKPLPACSVSTERENYSYHDKVYVSWSTTNATYVTFTMGASGDLPVAGSYGPQGTIIVSANVSGTPSITLLVSGEGGESSCKTTITVKR